MLVAVVRFPPVPTERESDFRAWFAWSNDQLGDAAGLVSRRLLCGSDRSYVALVEHDNAESFALMHASAVATEVQGRLVQVLEAKPLVDVYDVLDDLAPAGCCAGGHEATAAADHVMPSSGGDCCGGGDTGHEERNAEPVSVDH